MSRGLSLLWGAVLRDPSLVDLKQELMDDGILSADSIRKFLKKGLRAISPPCYSDL